MKVQIVFILFVVWFLGLAMCRPPVYQPNYHTNQEQPSHDYGYDDAEEENNNNNNRPGLPYRNNNVYNGDGNNRNLPYGNRPGNKRGQRPPYNPEEVSCIYFGPVKNDVMRTELSFELFSA